MRLVTAFVAVLCCVCVGAVPLKHLTGGGSCEQASGTCAAAGAACAGTLIPGQCPGSSVCCVPSSATGNCDKKGGKCQDRDRTQCNGGAGWQTGLCPGKFVCCVAPSPSPSPAPAPTNKKLVCLTFDDGPFDDISFRLADAMQAAGASATFFVNCHKDMPDARRKAWLASLASKGHSIGNHMCEHDIMAQSHYTNFYGALAKTPTGCLTQGKQQAVFKSHVQDNHDLWKTAGVTMKIARLCGDGRFNPCVVNQVESPTITGVTPHKHVAWNYEVGPNMKSANPTSYVMGHLKNPTGVELAATTPGGKWVLYSDPPGDPHGIILAHDLHYKDDNKVKLLADWVKAQQAKGFVFGKLNDNGQCVSK